MARPPITAKFEGLFRKQLNAALDYVEGLAGGSLADGDYGDITVSGGGTVWTIEAAALNAAADARIAAASIGDLADVTLTAPATNDVLAFDGAAWVNTPAASGGGSPIMAWLI